MLPVDVGGHLDEAIDGLRTVHSELRWVPSQRWHLTLEFLGECGPHEVDRQLSRWERRSARGWPMGLQLGGAGAFPHAWMARVLWIGIGGDLDGWRKVAAFNQQPHLTVARTRERTELTAVVDELSTYAGPSWTATDVVLVESHLRRGGERGPRYEPFASFALGG